MEIPQWSIPPADHHKLHSDPAVRTHIPGLRHRQHVGDINVDPERADEDGDQRVPAEPER